MNLLRNNYGFSMVQGMILAAIVAGSSLVANRLLVDQKKALKGAETRDQIEELHDTIYSILQVRLSCKETILENGLQGTLGNTTNNSTAYSLDKIAAHVDVVTPTPELVIETNKIYMNNSILVKSITLMPANDGTTGPREGTRNLEIVYERLNSLDSVKRTKAGTGAKEIKKTILISIQKNPTTPYDFVGCYALTGGKSTDWNATASNETGNDLSRIMCEELNSGGTSHKVFEWDAANSICKPTAACPGQIYRGFDSLGNVYCEDLKTAVDMSQFLDSTPPTTCTPGAQMKFEVDTSVTPNKVRIICIP